MITAIFIFLSVSIVVNDHLTDNTNPSDPHYLISEQVLRIPPQRRMTRSQTLLLPSNESDVNCSPAKNLLVKSTTVPAATNNTVGNITGKVFIIMDSLGVI